jgi:DNA-3-methyladenine glycosylase II
VAREAAEYLMRSDKVLAPVITQHGLCTITPHTDYYRQLVSSVVGQQLSVKAAAAIRKRFVDMCGGTFPTPQQILARNADELRAIGFSYAKAGYVHDIARRVLDGELVFEEFDNMSNDEIIKTLVAVKGVGEWTAHMFLMFCMARTDVLPVGDLGIRNGIRALYGFRDIPTPDDITDIAARNQWHPYETIASWYIWRSLDNEPA